MGVTFNRRPNSVNIPNSSDVKQNYFNHCNWKGINQNNNLFIVDQETFSDAKNVYVDDEGLLKSRLPIKLRNKFDETIKDFKIFDNIAVVIYERDGEWYIGILDNFSLIMSYSIVKYMPLKIFRNGNYIYIFTNEGFITYDIDEQSFSHTRMYEAITRIYVGSDFEMFESENLFSQYNRYSYQLFPTLPDESYIPDSINPNAYGRVGDYTHYLNENKIHHEITIDRDFKFLDVVHQPLIDTSDGFGKINCYGQRVSTSFIHNNMIYRWFNNRFEIASLGDKIFEVCYNFDENENDFVKIKIASSNEILIIYKTMLYVFDLTGEYKSIYAANGWYLDYDRLSDGTDTGYIEFKFSNVMSPEGVYDLKLSIIYQFKNGSDTTVSDSEQELILYSSSNTSVNDIDWICADTEVSYSGSKFPSYGAAVFYIDFSVGGDYLTFLDVWESGSFKKGYYLGSSSLEYGNVYRYSPNLNCYPFNEDEDVKYAIIPARGNYGEHSKFMFAYQSAQGTNYLLYGQYNGSSFENQMVLDYHQNGSYYYNGNLFKQSDGLYILDDEEWKKIIDLPGEFTSNSTSKYWFYSLTDANVTVSNYRTKVQPIYVKFEKEPIKDIDIILKGDKIYASKDNNFYVGEIVIDDADDLEKLYFKKSNYHQLDDTISGLHQISDNELAIFTPNETWYNTYSDGNYYYFKSKIIPKLKNNSSLITLPNSTTTLMPSVDGIIALNYQNFINTTEQSTINLTQDLQSIYDKFENSIRVLNWKSYTIFYEQENRNILIYDNRSSTWWYWDLPIKITEIFVQNNLLKLLSDNCLYEFVDDEFNYYDETYNEKCNIEWYIESQKLHFGFNNHYKHISNMTLTSIQNGDLPLSLNLNIKNYRKWVDNGKAENFDYDIDVVRTYIKRLNYAKVCEFQYKLSSDNINAINVPLALSNITIKYKVGGQVR